MNEYFYHAKAMQALQSSLGAGCPVVSWNGGTYSIVPSSAIRRKDLASGGFQLNADLRFNALVSVFGSAYSATTLKNALLQTKIVYLDDSYKVTGVTTSPGGYQVTVDCDSLNQNS